MKITDMLQQSCGLADIAAALDSMNHNERLAQIYQCGKKEQMALWELAQNSPCEIERDFVPKGTAPLTEVIHHGINTLPVFTKFQKRMAVPTAMPDKAIGYNEQLLKTITGPGYFRVTEGVNPDGHKMVVVDYTQPITEKCEKWPPILLNSQRLSRFIYNGTQDWMVRISKHVTLGRASRDNKWMPNWFLLVRQD